MSMPNIPDITPKIKFNRDEALTLLLASIALEELGLAHILNVEGEKMQSVLEMHKGKALSLQNIVEANTSIEGVIRSVTRLQILLQDKLETVSRLISPLEKPPPRPKKKCCLIGCAQGDVENKRDGFYCTTAILEARGKDSRKMGWDCCRFKYSLCRQSKNYCLSAVMIPILEKCEIQCPEEIHPQPTATEPNCLTIKGKGIMVIKKTCTNSKRGRVGFVLKVWDYGSYQCFQMDIHGESDAFSHHSGVIKVSSGKIRIKPACLANQ